MAQKYVFNVTGKGMYNAPKGAKVQVIKGTSTILMQDIIEAFKNQLGIKVSGSVSNYDIEKLF